MRKTVREQAILSFISETFHLLWRRRRLLYQTTVQDWRSRYAGSNSGNAWIVLYRLIFPSA
jgi:ABC-type polysaccharide/polyol phosphate export permease